jgi:AcrR family transcriptional regulator
MKNALKAAESRVDRSKTSVLTEAYRQLAINGLGGFSVDEVSRASGVSKTTIYRHWESRAALIIDACLRLGETGDIPDMGSIRTELDVLMAGFVQQLESTTWSTVYPSIIDAAERDKEMAVMQRQLHEKFMTPVTTIVERAKTRGELPVDASTADIAATLIGPLFYRRWFSKEAIPYAFMCAVVEGALLMARKGPVEIT